MRLFLPSRDQLGTWRVQEVTVLCFVRDPSKRSYFLEFLSLRTGRCIFATEIYEEFDYDSIDDLKFLTFEAEVRPHKTRIKFSLLKICINFIRNRWLESILLTILNF